MELCLALADFILVLLGNCKLKSRIDFSLAGPEATGLPGNHSQDEAQLFGVSGWKFVRSEDFDGTHAELWSHELHDKHVGRIHSWAQNANMAGKIKSWSDISCRIELALACLCAGITESSYTEIHLLH